MGPRGAAHGERRWGTYCGESRVGDRREILSLRGFASSTSDTMEQEPAAGNDGTGDNSNENNIEEPRPFAKVGDVVQFMGKWKGEVVFGEVCMVGEEQRLSFSLFFFSRWSTGLATPGRIMREQWPFKDSRCGFGRRVASAAVCNTLNLNTGHCCNTPTRSI